MVASCLDSNRESATEVDLKGAGLLAIGPAPTLLVACGGTHTYGEHRAGGHITTVERVDHAVLDERVHVFRVRDEVDAFAICTQHFVALIDTQSTPDLCHVVLDALAIERRSNRSSW